MRQIHVPANPGSTAPIRIALLAGAYQEPEDFQTAGFAAAVSVRHLAIDLVFIAPDLEHLLDRSVLDSLHTQVIADARQSGCAQTWLGGISLGGFIALAFAERHPDALDGLCLLGPYLGNRIVTREIARAGGVAQWHPSMIADDDEERRIWRCIRNLGAPASDARRLDVHLGIGRHDRFGHGHQLFADALPADRVDIIDGGHEWPVWLQLWELFLDRMVRRRPHVA